MRAREGVERSRRKTAGSRGQSQCPPPAQPIEAHGTSSFRATFKTSSRRRVGLRPFLPDIRRRNLSVIEPGTSREGSPSARRSRQRVDRRLNHFNNPDRNGDSREPPLRRCAGRTDRGSCEAKSTSSLAMCQQGEQPGAFPTAGPPPYVNTGVRRKHTQEDRRYPNWPSPSPCVQMETRTGAPG